DILLVGKALTAGYMGLSATLTSNAIFEKFNSEDLNKALMHGPTFMGNALACSSANASLDLFLKDDYEKKVKIISDFFAENLPKFKKFKKVITTRYIGAIAVIEIDTNWEEIKKMRLSFIEKNVFLRPFGNIIYVMPSFTISIAELKNIFSAIKKVLEEIS
ncbi:MAG: aminotransferase class III-fold pyridoxal phosphate-dependent enzyme, partial [Alphaproteobacteria bacterium]